MAKYITFSFILMYASLCCGDIVLKSGSSTAIFAKKLNYGLLEYTHKDVVVCNTMGYNGSVIAPEPGKFIGIGHKEGGVEQFVSLTLNIDGKEIQQIDGEYSGKIIKIRRTTRLDNVELVNSVTMKGDIFETNVQFKTLETQKVALFYVHQYCWSEKMNHFIAEFTDSSSFSHTFNSGNSFVLSGNPRHARWFALYDNVAKCGIAGAYDDATAQMGHSRFWDRINTHKLYYVPDFPKTLESGWSSPVYTFRFAAFMAEETNWKNTAETLGVLLSK